MNSEACWGSYLDTFEKLMNLEMQSSADTEALPPSVQDADLEAVEEFTWSEDSQEPLIAVDTGNGEPPKGLSGSSRDPRQGPGVRQPQNMRDPRQSYAPRSRFLMSGFQPLCLPQARTPQTRPTLLPQLRPMADPLSSFNYQQQLKLRIREALLMEKKDKSSRSSQPPPAKKARLDTEIQPLIDTNSQPEAQNPPKKTAIKTESLAVPTELAQQTERTLILRPGATPIANPTKRSKSTRKGSAGGKGGAGGKGSASAKPVQPLQVSCFIPNVTGAMSRTASPAPLNGQPPRPQPLNATPRRSSTPSGPEQPAGKKADPPSQSSRPNRKKSKPSSLPPVASKAQAEKTTARKAADPTSKPSSVALLAGKQPSQKEAKVSGNGHGSKNAGPQKAVQNSMGSLQKLPMADAEGQPQKKRKPSPKANGSERRPKQAKTGKALQPNLESVTKEGQQVDPSEITIFGKTEAAADWAASSFFRLKDTSPKEAVRYLRQEALSFAFPKPKSECPVQETRKLDSVPLRPLQSSASRDESPAEDCASKAIPPSCLSEAHAELLARFRCSRWHDETAMPAVEPPQAASTPLKRRSARIRTAPASFIPFFGGRRRDRIENQEGKLRVGSQHQAELPSCAKKPPPDSTPTVDEACWLQHFIMQAGQHGPPDQPMPVKLVRETPAHQRQYACGKGMDCLLKAADILALGLDRVGSACATDWSTKDINAFEKGLDECKRDFTQIAADHLPHMGPHKVGDFYYNVWKTRGIQQAKAWYHRRDEARRQQEEAERLMESRREELQALGQVRRQLKDSLIWLKSLARDPLENQLPRSKAERIKAASKALAQANVREKAQIGRTH